MDEAAAEAAARNSAHGLDPAELDVAVTAAAWEHGEDVTVEATYPYEIDCWGWSWRRADLKTETTERVE